MVIPTYNEAENLPKIISAVLDLPAPVSLLIVDDNSPDGTGEIAEKMALEYPGRVSVMHRQGKQGLGTAYIQGFRRVLATDADAIGQMDADFSHNPEDLIRLWDACENGGADLSIGSRYISGVNVVNWPMGRVLMSYIASMYVRLVTGMKIMDTTAGFKCYRREVLRNINPGHIRLVGYGFQIEMKFTAWQLGYNIVELPIIFTDRRAGTSKMSGSIFGEAMWGVLRMKLASIFRKPHRIET
jgi:dolichol-phosphate mannosyltransferase